MTEPSSIEPPPPPQEPKQFQPPARGEAIFAGDEYFFIGNQIGRGAFGTIYECTDEWGNQLIAKVLLPNGSYEVVRENWLAELQKLRDLRHPNVTFVRQAFEYKDTFYLIIERCYGTLEPLITAPGIDPEIWIPYIARDVLQALNYIHSNGYVHKDIHLGNVFVSQTHDRMVPSREPVWSFKIGDLGISRLETDIHAINTLLAQWMLPPEAIDMAQFGKIGRTVDIYHTGLVLLAILRRQVPTFTREEIIAGIPRKTAESLSSRFAPVIARALRRHVSARTPTAMQFWREIQSVTASP